MSNLTPGQLRSIADQLDKAASLINTYQVQNFGSIPGTDHIIINNRETEIMLHANRLRNEAITLTVENSTEFIESIGEAIQKIENVISTIETVGKVINIASSVAALGLSIATGNIPAVGTSIGDILDVLGEDA